MARAFPTSSLDAAPDGRAANSGSATNHALTVHIVATELAPAAASLAGRLSEYSHPEDYM